MELAKLTSKGQITIPKQIRSRLKLKEGDKIFFIEEKGKIYFQNGSQIALTVLQKEMEGVATKSNFRSERDIVNYIKKMRHNTSLT